MKYHAFRRLVAVVTSTSRSSTSASGTERFLRSPMMSAATFPMLCAAALFAQSTTAAAQFAPPRPGMPVVPGNPQSSVSPNGISAPTVPPETTHQRLLKMAGGHAVCLVIGEGIASQFVGSITVDEGPFQDNVMGAHVSGKQKTNARTSLDFTPDAEAARMLFVLKGVTMNDTVAQLPRAAVRSAGTFRFELTKQIEFNGQSIRTWTPSAFMTINQQNLGASTAMSNVPLLGPLASNIVMNVAEQRKPVSEGIAAHRVTQQVAPTFNSQLDEALAKLNEAWNGPLKSKMSQSGMLPSRISTATTHDALLCGFEFQPPLAAAADVSGMQLLRASSRAPTTLVTRRLVPASSPQYGADLGMQAPTPYSLDAQSLSDRACVLIHTSLIENLAERFHLAGREIPDTRLMELLGTPAPAGKSGQPQLYTLLFDSTEPVTATADAGDLIVSLRVGFRPIVGPELPTQEIKIAVTPELTADKVVLKSTVRSIEPVGKEKNDQLGLAAKTLIKQAIQDRLKEFSFNRGFEIARQGDRPFFPVQIHSITLVDGWITAVINQPEWARSADADADLMETSATR